MGTEAWSEGNERLFDPKLDREPIIVELGHLGLVDALEFDHPNPPEASQRWAENPCVFPSED